MVRIISFGGYNWWVKSSGKSADCRLDPGSNYFSDSTDMVWVDPSTNYLHLKIALMFDVLHIDWYCSEVVGISTLG